MKVCARCGTKAPDGAPFCPSCGAPFGTADPIQTPSKVKPRRRPIGPWRLLLWAVALVLCCGFPLAVMFPLLQSARIAIRMATALEQTKAVDLAVLKYADDHHDRFPSFADPHRLAHDLAPYCRLENLDAVVAEYRWNLDYSGKSEDDLTDPMHAWLFWEAVPPARQQYTIAFADGQVTGANAYRFNELVGPAPESKHAGGNE